VALDEEMVYFDIKVYHKGYFGYENGAMRYIGEELTIGDYDSDFWCVYEAEEHLNRFGYPKSDIAAMWYKDPAVHDYSIGLRMFLDDDDALEMCRITAQRGHVELFVVHESGPEEGFPEIGYVDVGGDLGGGNDDDDYGDGEDGDPNAENEGAAAEEAIPNGPNEAADVVEEAVPDAAENLPEAAEDVDGIFAERVGAVEAGAGGVAQADTIEEFAPNVKAEAGGIVVPNKEAGTVGDNARDEVDGQGEDNVEANMGRGDGVSVGLEE
ncbi:hypothetical protein PIB30_102907, partial [Stylosanthes scabra]|nr:hypothetical protein [Stylosanthes scabra]